MKQYGRVFVPDPAPKQPKPECSRCGEADVVVRIGGRNYCSDCSDQGYSRAIFAAMAGDD